MLVYHTSPVPIESITTDGRFEEFLFFSSEPYQMYQGSGVATYSLELDPDSIIEASQLFYEDDADTKLSELVNDLSNELTINSDLAMNLIDESANLWDLDFDSEDLAEISWNIQLLTAKASKLLGYEGVELEDEQGTAYLIDMLGKESELQLVNADFEDESLEVSASYKNFKMENIMKKKSGHHMWNAQSDDNGQVTINRTQAEREEFSEEEDFLMAVTASSWGLFGASLIDQYSGTTLPASIKDRFNIVAKQLKESGEEPPRVRSWEELRKAFGNEQMSEAREFVSEGMKVRQASRYLNLPFVVTADLVEDLEVVGKTAMKDIVDRVKQGDKKVVKDYGKVASNVSRLFKEAQKEGNVKIAVDESAKDYWKSYYGEYGDQLVSEVKKRVKADVAYEWLRKNGVDEEAAKYWSNYYSDGYGAEMTKDVPKMLSPKAKKDVK